ncbi:hypothetical protein EI427_07465 [Flammeovirga pectinis]|uniref:Outer membrane protein beta-barrel domain-containing protein n=1 Tax=Flammeovirga pectinis TaxID=2494373 RepID=A0A3Q9FQA5_9BACT|nr:hypothetical protein [Flammeovirga pectinis]AZQ62084.1 hypothetical protein EI427_07465 [Flammeovirga pectinis]
MSFKQKIALFFFIISLYSGIVHFSYAQETEDKENAEMHTDEKEHFLFQTSKGQWNIGFGYGLGIAYQNQTLNFTNSEVLIDAFGGINAGYFIFDKLLLIGFLHGGIRTVSFSYSNKNSEYFLGGGPKIRKYLKNGIFGEASYTRSKTELSYVVNESVSKFDGFANVYGVGLGFGNFWMKRISLEVILNYYYLESNYQNSLIDLTKTSSNFSITASISFTGGKTKTE